MKRIEKRKILIIHLFQGFVSVKKSPEFSGDFFKFMACLRESIPLHLFPSWDLRLILFYRF